MLVTQASGQSDKELISWPPVQVIDVEQGLPQAFVSGVVEDSDGFVWVSTLGGLARYDGRHMVAFPHRPDDSTSPTNGAIIFMERSANRAGQSTSIWLWYDTGAFDLLNTRTGRCQHFPQLTKRLRGLPLRRIMRVDRQGNLWGIIHQQGIFHYNVVRNRFTWLRRATHGLISDTLNSITEDPQGSIWLIAPTGVSRLSSPDRLVFQSSRFVKPLEQLRDMVANDDYKKAIVRPNGEIIINARTRLLVIDAQRAMVIRSLAFASRPSRNQSLLSQGADGQAYLLVDGTLYRYTGQRGLTPLWRYAPPDGKPADELLTTDLCVDQSGVCWLGANTKGLFRIDLETVPLQAYRYRTTFCVDVLRTSLGLSLPTYVNWPFSELNDPASYFFRSGYDKQHRLWIGLGREVELYNARNKSFARLPLIPLPTIPEDFLHGLSMAPDGRLWIVFKTGTPYVYNPLAHQWQAPFGKLAVSANNLLADANALWVTTIADGLLRFDLRTRQYRSIRFTSRRDGRADEHLLDLHQDLTHPDWLWISGYNGLIGFNKRTGRYRRFTTAQGLPNNTVYSILPDRQGYLWLSTNRGLCRFHPVSHTTLNFSLSDGLPGEEFNRFHRLQLPDGRLAFGGVKGWVLLDPARIKADTTRPVVVLTGLKINNQPIDQYGIRSPLARPLNDLPSLRLNPDQNYLSVDFAALHYHQPDRVKYRYQLLGYDANWIVSQLPEASYTKLPPGKYTLRVSAANAAGQWSHQIKELPVEVLPPLWASDGAYAFYILLIGAAFFGLIRFRETRILERQELVLRQRQAEEMKLLDEAKTRFFANVSHELRTPLTLMLGPLGTVLNHGRIDTQDEQLIRTADRSARQLLGLVNELLDLTRLDAGKVVLQPQSVRLTQFLQECLAPFAQQAHQLGITLMLETTATDDLTVQMDAGKVRQVIQNLVANACRFTGSGGWVGLATAAEGNQLQIRVRDTGRGISAADLPHIFDRYFQTHQPDAPIQGGTGIGLALCYELVRLMQGTITVESILDQGSTFCVTLPGVVVVHKPIDSSHTPITSPPLVNSRQAGHLGRVATSGTESTTLADDTVLVVEDNADLRDYLTAVLTPAFRVVTAHNGQAALAVLTTLPSRPSLLIADIMMPIMDGFQLLEALKAHPAYRSIPVVMLTARTDMADKLRALRLGVDDYLLKPFDEAELLARVTALLHNQRERQWQTLAEIDVETTEETDADTIPPVSADDLAWLTQLEVLIDTRLGEFDLTADGVASALNMTRRTFYRTTKRLTGLTPAQYIAEARFREARRLLENRQVSSVKHVAHQVGFRQVNYFSQLYRQRFGKRPTDYL